MYPKEFLKLIYTSLPEKISDAIASEDTLDSLIEIEDRYQLNRNQRDELLLEVTMRFVGITSSDKFIETLVKKLNEPINTVNKIVENITSSIFSKIPGEILAAQEKQAQTILSDWTKKQPLEMAGNGAPTKSTELEIPPEMELVPEGKVIDHTPRATPVQPKPPVETPAPVVIETPKIQSSPVVQEPIQNPTPAPKPSTPISPTPTSYADGKDPYREPLE